MVKATKKLIIVCDEKTEQYANYLPRLPKQLLQLQQKLLRRLISPM